MGDVAVTIMAHLHKSHKYYINPNSQGKVLWDLYIALLIVYSCVTVPYRMGFARPSVGFMAVVDAIVDISFAIDIALRCVLCQPRSACVTRPVFFEIFT